MNTTSNAQLKKLKEGKSHITHIGVKTPLFIHLIARLEAAERFCNSVKGTPGWLIPDYDAWKAWRKEAGK